MAVPDNFGAGPDPLMPYGAMADPDNGIGLRTCHAQFHRPTFHGSQNAGPDRRRVGYAPGRDRFLSPGDGEPTGGKRSGQCRGSLGRA